jgi:hypothetical protein
MPICRSLHSRRRSKSGLRTKRASARRTALCDNGRGEERGLDSPQTNATRAPISSAPSAQPKARARRWRCRVFRHRGDAAPSRGNQAHHALSRHALEHHADLAAFARARTQSRGERLAVPAPDLAVQPRLRDLRRHRRCRMRSLEQAHRPTRRYNLNRHAPVGSRWSEVRALGITP